MQFHGKRFLQEKGELELMNDEEEEVKIQVKMNKEESLLS
jgi:hypothetical protein